MRTTALSIIALLATAPLAHAQLGTAVGGTVNGTVGGVAGQVGGNTGLGVDTAPATDAARSGVGQTVEQTGERAGSAAHRAGSAAHKAGTAAEHRTSQTTDSVSGTVKKGVNGTTGAQGDAGTPAGSAGVDATGIVTASPEGANVQGGATTSTTPPGR